MQLLIPGSLAQLAGAAPTDSPPPVTRDLCPCVLGVSMATLMATEFVLNCKCTAKKLRTHILMGKTVLEPRQGI